MLEKNVMSVSVMPCFGFQSSGQSFGSSWKPSAPLYTPPMSPNWPPPLLPAVDPPVLALPLEEVAVEPADAFAAVVRGAAVVAVALSSSPPHAATTSAAAAASATGARHG